MKKAYESPEAELISFVAKEQISLLKENTPASVDDGPVTDGKQSISDWPS